LGGVAEAELPALLLLLLGLLLELLLLLFLLDRRLTEGTPCEFGGGHGSRVGERLKIRDIFEFFVQL
jgi:hypothetical protein